MMNISNKYIKNSLVREKNKLVPIKITIIVAVIALSVFIFTMGSTIKNSREIAIKSYGDYHAAISVEMDSSKVELLEKNVSIDKIAYGKTLDDEYGMENDFIYKINVADSNFIDLISTKLINGKIPEKVSEVIIPFSLSQDLNLRNGDLLKTKTKNGEIKEYIVTGNYDHSTYTWDNEIILYTFDEPENIKNTANAITLWYKDKSETYDITPKIYSLLGEKDYKDAVKNGGLRYNSYYLSSYFINSQDFYFPSENMPKILIIGSSIIALFFIILIKNIFTIWEKKHLREYGLLISIGATKTDLIKMILKRLFLISLKPVTIGLALGTLIDFILIKIANKYYILSQQNLYMENVRSLNFTINPILIGLILLFTILVLTIVALWPITALFKISPLEAMNEYRVSNSKKKKFMPINKDSFVKDLYKINKKNNRGKHILSSFAIVLSIFIFSLTLSLSSGLGLELKYNSKDELEYFDYKIDYWHPKTLNEDLLENLTDGYSKDYMTFRKIDLYLDKDNYYKNIMDDNYYNSIYPKYIEQMGKDELSVTVVGIENRKFKEIINEQRLSMDDFSSMYDCLIVNSAPIDYSKPYAFIEHDKIFKENNQDIILNEFHSNEELSNKFIMKPLAYTLDRNILKVPQAYGILFLVPMDNYLSLISDVKYPSESMVRESIFLKSSDERTFEDLKEYVNINLNPRNVEIYNHENIKAYEKNSNKILYSILFAFSIISGIIGLSASYSSTESYRQSQEKNYALLQVVGMDYKGLKKLIHLDVFDNILKISIMSIIGIGIAGFLGTTAYKPFTILQILANMNFSILLVYIIIIFIILYKNNNKLLNNIDLNINSRIM